MGKSRIVRPSAVCYLWLPRMLYQVQLKGVVEGGFEWGIDTFKNRFYNWREAKLPRVTSVLWVRSVLSEGIMPPWWFSVFWTWIPTSTLCLMVWGRCRKSQAVGVYIRSFVFVYEANCHSTCQLFSFKYLRYIQNHICLSNLNRF